MTEMTPLRRNGDDAMHRGTIDEHFEPKRATDLSWIAKINTTFLKYNWLFALAVAGMIAAGFDWKTPKSQFDDLRAEIRLNRSATITALDSLSQRADDQQRNNDRVVDILEIFSIDLCLRRKADPYVYQRLKCDTVLRGGGSR